MSTPSRRRASPKPAADEAIAWFAALQRARREHDFQLAARSERVLEELGYVVRVVRPIPSSATLASISLGRKLHHEQELAEEVAHGA